ncbi:hypothetical protein D3C81_1775950 [compost metagenome]
MYSVAFYKEFENELVENFKVEGLVIGDLGKNRNIEVILYFADDIFLGYSTDLQEGSFQFDDQKINISQVKKKLWGNEGNSIVKNILTAKELKLVNLGDIYISNINGKDYYHLKELEDGDFLGFDQDGVFFKLTHDPFYIQKIDRDCVIDFLL